MWSQNHPIANCNPLHASILRGHATSTQVSTLVKTTGWNLHSSTQHKFNFLIMLFGKPRNVVWDIFGVHLSGFCLSSCRIWSVFMYTSFQANFFFPQQINSTPGKLPEPMTVAYCFICTVLWVLAPCDSGTLQIPDALRSFAKIRSWISSNEFAFWWCCLYAGVKRRRVFVIVS